MKWLKENILQTLVILAALVMVYVAIETKLAVNDQRITTHETRICKVEEKTSDIPVILERISAIVKTLEKIESKIK